VTNLRTKVTSQGAISSSKLMDGDDLKLSASKGGRFHPEKAKLSGRTKSKHKS